MKQEKATVTKKTKIIITAAVLLTGCLCGCTPDTDSSDTSQSGNVSSSGDAAVPSLFKTVADNVKGDLQTKSEGSTAEPIDAMAAHHTLKSAKGGNNIWQINCKWKT